MRIGYVLEAFPKISVTFILGEMLELERRGFELVIFALSKPFEPVTHEKVSLLKAEVVRPDRTGLVSVAAPLCGALFGRQRTALQLQDIRAVGLKKSLWGLAISSWLAKAARERGVDYLHAHFAGDAAWIAMRASQIGDLPYSFTAHAGGIFGWPYLLKEKINRARFVVTISDFNKEYLASEFNLPLSGQEKIHIIHCGVDLEEFRLREKSPSEVPELLSVARLEEKKGHVYLLEALKLLKDKGTKFLCRVVGDGALVESLKDRARELDISDSVTFLGAMPQKQVYSLLNRANLFVLPCVEAADGNMDGIPVALMEAMAVGVPVVSTRLSGIPELVEDGASGLLADPGDATGLAAAIARIIEDQDFGASLAAAARRKVEEEFDVEKNAAELAGLFRL